jgi:tRNA(Ile)-lysidine synthase
MDRDLLRADFDLAFVTDSEAERLRQDLARCLPSWSDGALIGVAVSGGPDSVALLLLARSAFPGRVLAATIDHRLRREARAEAEFVANLCAELVVPHAILAPTAPIRGNLQAGARAARYALLDGWAVAHGLSCVATAHHVEDQAETLLMRLVRGAGVGGLAGIRHATGARRVPVVRPVLGWRRTELAEIVRRAGIVPVEDPGNRDERFTRTLIRRRMAEQPWLDPRALAMSAQALAEAEEALGWAAARLCGERLAEHEGCWTLDPSDLPNELLRRIVIAALARAGGTGAPRGAEVQGLIAALASERTATLSGIVCRPGPRWRFTPEPPRGSA